MTAPTPSAKRAGAASVGNGSASAWAVVKIPGNGRGDRGTSSWRPQDATGMPPAAQSQLRRLARGFVRRGDLMRRLFRGGDDGEAWPVDGPRIRVRLGDRGLFEPAEDLVDEAVRPGVLGVEIQVGALGVADDLPQRL